MPSASYLAVTYEALPDAQDVLVAEAWSAGTLGCQVNGHQVVAYFVDSGGDPTTAMRLTPGVREVDCHRVDDRDWLAAYRNSISLIPVGDSWLLDPREPDAGEPARAGNRVVLRLPARRAFGTGGHESTRLALRLLERVSVSRRSVLDFGYGSGVLSFAAISLGAARCVGIGRDPIAALVGGLNRTLNRSLCRGLFLMAADPEALADVAWVDILLVNVRPEGWLPSAESLQAGLRPGAEIICSGFLGSEVEDLGQEFAALNWQPTEWMRENEWGASLLRVGPA